MPLHISANMHRFHKVQVPASHERILKLLHATSARVVAIDRHFLVGADDGRFWGYETGRPHATTYAPVRMRSPGAAQWWIDLNNAAAFATGRISVDDHAVLYVVEGLYVRPYLFQKKKDDR